MRSGRRLLLLAVLAGCAQGGPAPADTPTDGDPAVEIPAMLDASAEAWDAGDLDGFLNDYLDSPETSFAGANGVTYGLADIREAYRRGYWQDGRPPQTLDFEILDVRPLGARHALTLGRYLLSGRTTGELEASGYFSLVLVRTDDGWRIIHDHSSASPEPTG